MPFIRKMYDFSVSCQVNSLASAGLSCHFRNMLRTERKFKSIQPFVLKSSPLFSAALEISHYLLNFRANDLVE